MREPRWKTVLIERAPRCALRANSRPVQATETGPYYRVRRNSVDERVIDFPHGFPTFFSFQGFDDLSEIWAGGARWRAERRDISLSGMPPFGENLMRNVILSRLRIVYTTFLLLLRQKAENTSLSIPHLLPTPIRFIQNCNGLDGAKRCILEIES